MAKFNWMRQWFNISLFNKIGLLAFSFLICSTLKSQSYKTIVIDIKNCETNQLYDSLRPFLLHINNSNRVGFEIVEVNGQNQITIDSVQFDSSIFQDYTNYIRIGFLNKFDLDSEVFILAEDEDTIDIILCHNRYKNELKNHEPIISKLQDGESFKLKWISAGCFHYYEDSLEIIYVDNLYSLTYNDTVKLLQSEEVELIKKFEFQLNLLPLFGGCTSSVFYTLSYKKEEIEYVDGTCDWHGISKLLKAINLKSN